LRKGSELMANERIVWIDYAKAFAIVLIVASHVQHQLLKMGLCLDTGVYHYVDGALYSFHVPLFFFLSGLFFRAAFHKRGFKLFAISKLRTILYPFLVWSLLQTAIEIALSYTGDTRMSWTALATCLYYPRAHFWFLYALFFMSLISGLLAWKSQRAAPVGILVLAVALYFSVLWVDLGPFADLARNYVFFAAGVLVEQTGVLLRGKRVGWVALLLAALQFVGLEYAFIRFDWNMLWHGRLILAGSGILFSIILAIAVSERWSPRTLEYIGAKTMPIYCAHVLAAYAVMIAIKTVTGTAAILPYIAAGMVAGVVLPLIADALATRLRIPLFTLMRKK